MISATAESYWGVPGYAFFWIVVAIAVGLFALRIWHLYRLMRLGKPERRWDSPWFRFRDALTRVLAQVCSLRSFRWKDRAGLGHALIFWGFVVFVIGYAILIFIGEGLGIYSVFEGTGFERRALLPCGHILCPCRRICRLSSHRRR